MKKTFLKLIATALLVCMIVALAACTPKPQLDFTKAKENLEEEGYLVVVIGDSLTATKDLEDFLQIYVFDNEGDAEDMYEDLKKERDDDIEELREEIKSAEGEEKEELQDELDDMQEWVVGISGKTVWIGTKDAIKASK